MALERGELSKNFQKDGVVGVGSAESVTPVTVIQAIYELLFEDTVGTDQLRRGIEIIANHLLPQPTTPSNLMSQEMSMVTPVSDWVKEYESDSLFLESLRESLRRIWGADVPTQDVHEMETKAVRAVTGSETLAQDVVKLITRESQKETDLDNVKQDWKSMIMSIESNIDQAGTNKLRRAARYYLTKYEEARANSRENFDRLTWEKDSRVLIEVASMGGAGQDFRSIIHPQFEAFANPLLAFNLIYIGINLEKRD